MKPLEFYNNNELPDQLAFMFIDGKKFYCPRITVRKELRKEAESHLRSKYNSGKYTEPTKINEILKYQFSFYNERLNEIMPLTFCKDWLAFTLFQYEISGEIVKKFKDQTLDHDDYFYWRNNGPIFRQTADFLCDKFIEYSVERYGNDLDPYTDSVYYDTIWICAENCIEYASTSNFTYMLMQKESFLEILPPRSEIFLNHGINNQSSFEDCNDVYQNQINRDIKLRQEYIEGEAFDHDIKKHISILDIPLKQYLGMSYSDIIYLLTSISLSTRPITSPDKIPMVDKEKYLNEFSNKGGFPLNSIKRLFEALTLSKQKLKNKPREVWNYKQQNRISKKPFLKITYQGKDHLLWSDQKLKDFLLLLDIDVTFKNFPSELTNKKVAQAIDNISNQAGKWFESQVILQMNKLNIVGSSAKRRIISNKSNKEIACLAGQIDFLGLSKSDSSIILLECKMINSGFEARGFRQDKDKFIKGKNSFVMKLIRKLNWVFNNFDLIRKILCENYNIDESEISRKISCGFITYYTTMVPCFLDLFPCVSLVEFIDKYKNELQWPYPNGIKTKKVNEEMACL